MKKIFLTLLGALLALGVGACSRTGSASPYPVAVSPHSGATYPFTGTAPEGYPPQGALFHTTHLELTVWDVERSVEKASHLASEAGGYRSALQIWEEGGVTVASVKLVVPSNAYEDARLQLRKLGTAKREITTSAPAGRQGQFDVLSEFVVELRPRLAGPDWDALQYSPSRPMRTFYQALNVFTGLFAFLLDAAIWIIVVIGPFVLLAWFGKRLWRRWGG